MADDIHQLPEPLSPSDSQQVQGGSGVEYNLTVTDTETEAGTLIPIKIKHNV